MNRKSKTKNNHIIMLLTVLFLLTSFTGNASAALFDCAEIPSSCPKIDHGCCMIWYNDCEMGCVNPVTGEGEGRIYCFNSPE